MSLLDEETCHPELVSGSSESHEVSPELPSATRSSEVVPEFTVSEATALFNQIFETATPTITVIGEVANFKVNQGKWVFFDLKDEESSLGCFMSVYNLRIAVEDGMKVAIVARPQITKWGKFSLTVQQIRPVGEGSIKRAFELLRAKLDKEGLFAPERKRLLPELPQRIGVISSIDAAGYKDFVKIISQRMGGMEIIVAPVQVQGEVAAEQIIAALKYFNEMSDLPEVICLLRGGGSRDDLIAFDDEKLVREIAASRVPIITGVGHEIDTTLADLVADVRASTPSNAAEILVPDKREILAGVEMRLGGLLGGMRTKIERAEKEVADNLDHMKRTMENMISVAENRLRLLNDSLQHLNPREVLRRGYAIVRTANGEILHTKPQVSDKIVVENLKFLINAKVENVMNKVDSETSSE
ncbi:exodeoxyribonuclease VII large subunit [Candidatus Saccharibacteria bacterium]|nr:exodeoxyribonuclease VII large subunit [Candidatus Saccharibacteria bacterium]